MAKTPKEKTTDIVHIDLLEIDMRTGAHWLSPAQKNKNKPAHREIQDRHRAKFLAERKAKRERSREKALAGQEQWPRAGESREAFMQRCSDGLMAGGMGEDKAHEVCAAKWEDAQQR